MTEAQRKTENFLWQKLEAYNVLHPYIGPTRLPCPDISDQIEGNSYHVRDSFSDNVRHRRLYILD